MGKKYNIWIDQKRCFKLNVNNIYINTQKLYGSKVKLEVQSLEMKKNKVVLYTPI